MWEVVGQENAVGLLQRSLERGKLSHAYLFVGPEHVGKRTLAINLAQALNCEGEEPPCGRCESCRRIASGKHADVQAIELGGTGSSRTEIGIDQIRELQSSASLKPYEGKHRVFIIDGAEHLSAEAANCLLKTLEEPPPQVLILLLTANDGLLMPTVLSRCQRIELHSAPIPLVEQALVERGGVPLEKARILARLSRGRLGWALSVKDDKRLLQERAERLSKLLGLDAATRGERFSHAAQLALEFNRNRDAVGEVLELWLGWWRDLLLVKEGCSQFITNVDQETQLRARAGGYTLAQIKGFIESIRKAEEQLGQRANPRLVLEVLMLSIPERGVRKGVMKAAALG